MVERNLASRTNLTMAVNISGAISVDRKDVNYQHYREAATISRTNQR